MEEDYSSLQFELNEKVTSDLKGKPNKGKFPGLEYLRDLSLHYLQMSRDFDEIVITTDGSCNPNPGPGGWGVVTQYKKDGEVLCQYELSGADPGTTNQRMELTAAIKGLKDISIHKGVKVNVVTDSKYVKDGITSWILKWLVNGWRNAKKQPIENQDLWKELHIISTQMKAEWSWVKAHNGHPENERADKIANEAAQNASNKRKREEDEDEVCERHYTKRKITV